MENEEYHCENCGNTGWDWENVILDDGRETDVLVPCDCVWCMHSCPDIEDAYDRSE